jgi:hypothetical protein
MERLEMLVKQTVKHMHMGRKSLIVVNNPSSAGSMKIARCLMNDAVNIDIVFLDFPFEAFTFPITYTEAGIKALNAQNDFKEWWWLTDAFCEFLKINLDEFEQITVWHGNTTSDLMLLYFFADYYRKPFHVLDVSLYAKNGRCIEPAFLSPVQLAKLQGKERLLTEEEVAGLRDKAMSLKISDTGYHQVNDEGEVYNVLPEDYTGIIHSVLQRHGGELKMSRLVGELLGLELKGCSTHFVEKLIIHHLRKDRIKAFWIADGSEVDTKDCFFKIGQNPNPKEFCYRTVNIRLT